MSVLQLSLCDANYLSMVIFAYGLSWNCFSCPFGGLSSFGPFQSPPGGMRTFAAAAASALGQSSVIKSCTVH